MFATLSLAFPVMAMFIFFPLVRLSGPLDGGIVGPSRPLPPSLNCPQRATARLSYAPNPVPRGDNATLSWAVTLPYECSSTYVTLDGRRIPLQGSMTITPMVNTTYRLLFGGEVMVERTVQVRLPLVVRIEDNTRQSRRLLVQALGTANTVVLLSHSVDMDLTGEENIAINENVVLMSEAPQVAAPVSGTRNVLTFASSARDSRHLGPRLYTRSRPKALFSIRCDKSNRGENVRLMGFRLQGPTPGIGDGNLNLERGISIRACSRTEIANMELSGWSGAAIYLRDVDDDPDDEEGMRPPDGARPGQGTWIHDNFIHHNQHKGTNGYGIDVHAGAYALIERNVFDFNRHGIAGSGAEGTSYTAQHNLVLRGGGRHEKFYNPRTHQFDVHGDDHCIPFLPDVDYPLIDADEHIFNCGNAGSAFWITGNAFQYDADNAIKIRGSPRIGAYIQQNVFAHSKVSDAVSFPYDVLDPEQNVVVQSNTAGVDSFGQYGVCDFDGDGKDDLFLATGVSWWFSSAGKMHWVFLSARTERLHQVGLGDFDGDGRCDVFAVRRSRWGISSGGNRPWAPLPGNYTLPFDQLAFGDFNGDGRKDVFHRAPNGQWTAISPGVDEWMLARSPQPLGALRFGDFDGDAVTDVLGIDRNVWSVSWSGRTSFVPLPANHRESLSSILIGDVDGIRGDDIARLVPNGLFSARWEVSSGGATAWQPLTTIEWQPAWPVFAFIGQFDHRAGADLLAVDSTRVGRLLSNGRSTFAVYARYAY